MRLTCLLPLAILPLSFVAIGADIIHLRDGRKVEGVVVGQDRTRIRIRVGSAVRTFPKADIRRVQYGGVADPAVAERKRLEALRRRQEKERAEQAELARKRKEAGDRQAAEDRAKREEQRRRELEADQLGFKARGGTDLGALWRSAVAPGWGMVYKDRTFWGFGHAGSFLAAVGAGVSYSAHAVTDRRAYQSGTFISTLWGVALRAPELTFVSYSLDRASRTTYELSLRRQQAAVGIVGLVYLGQLAHAFLAAPGRPTATSARRSDTDAVSWSFALELRSLDTQAAPYRGAGGRAIPEFPSGPGEQWAAKAAATIKF